MPSLNELLQQAWSEYDRFQNEPRVVRPSAPVLYFGDSRRYLESPLKIVTVCLNPSREEFPTLSPFSRFPAAEPAHSGSSVTPEQRAALLRTALDDYFKEQPYTRWFNSSFEAFLEGMDASFYEHSTNTALHTDLCTPLATNPTWSGLDDHTTWKLSQTGVKLWHQLIETLQPDIALVSLRRSLLSSIRFRSLSSWRPLISFSKTKDGQSRSKPYVVEASWRAVGDSKRTLFVFGEASQLPFGNLSHPQQGEAGRAVLAEMRAAVAAR